MLSVNSYTPEYVEACRARIAEQLAAFRAVATEAPDGSPLGRALGSLEAALFANMVLALDGMFCHRSRTMEGKDGNPLNEVRILGTSLTEHAGVFTPGKTLKLGPQTSVLGYAPGDPISLSADDFERLAAAFLAAIARTYPPRA